MVVEDGAGVPLVVSVPIENAADAVAAELRTLSQDAALGAAMRALRSPLQRAVRRGKIESMRYLVTARVKPGKSDALARAIDEGTLGEGSVAGDEYLRNMASARQLDDGRVQWVEVCYCATPLAEEREYWEEYLRSSKKCRTRMLAAAAAI